MQVLEHCKETFKHNAPVLCAEALSFQQDMYFCLTESRVYFWYRERQPGMCPTEGEFVNAQLNAPAGTKFVDMVIINGYAVIGTTQGRLLVIQVVQEQTGYSLKQLDIEIQSNENEVLDLCYCDNNLFVLHRDGWLNRF